jgi:mannose-6-phosphate isomerase-like protein (cupin superfamily)
MSTFETKSLPKNLDAIAPDGSEVRLLLTLKAGGMAHFQLGTGEISKAVTHRTIEEIWYFLGGRGQMWRSHDGQAEIVNVEPGVSITIPLETNFQFRASSDGPLSAVGITMPPWPGDGEAIMVKGVWEPTMK